MPLVAGQTASATGFGTTVAVAFPSNVTAGNLLCYGHNAHNTFSSVTDTLNTPAIASNPGDLGGNNIFVCLHYVENAVGGATTATRAQGADNAAIGIAEYSGVATASALDQTAAATAFSAAGNSGNTAALAQADELVIGFIGTEGETMTAGSGYTEDLEYAGPRPGQLQSKTVAATTAVSSTTTITASTNWVALVATFKLGEVVPPADANIHNIRSLRPRPFAPGLAR